MNSMEQPGDDRVAEALKRLAAADPAPGSTEGLGPKVRQLSRQRSRRQRALALAALIAPIGLAVVVVGGRKGAGLERPGSVAKVAEPTAASPSSESAIRDELARLDAELAVVERRIARHRRTEDLGREDSLGMEPAVALKVRFEGEAARLASFAELNSAEPEIAEPLREAVRRIYPNTVAGRQLARGPAPERMPVPPNEG
jgi:hypothetical protein